MLESLNKVFILSYPVKCRFPSIIMICLTKLRFSSHLRVKVGHQGPQGAASAQPWFTYQHGCTRKLRTWTQDYFQKQLQLVTGMGRKPGVARFWFWCTDCLYSRILKTTFFPFHLPMGHFHIYVIWVLVPTCNYSFHIFAFFFIIN